MKDFDQIKNIVFDLGNVILDVKPELTLKAFNNLGISNPEAYYNMTMDKGLLVDFELGNISEHDFRKTLKQFANAIITDTELDNAWNAMLLPIQKERIELLNSLKSKFNLYLLSNTNSIHYKKYSSNYSNIFDINNSSIFKKCYYSHILHLRKPNLEIFGYILEDAQINSAQTLFIDDLHLNTEAAKKMDFNIEEVSPDNSLLTIFS